MSLGFNDPEKFVADFAGPGGNILARALVVGFDFDHLTNLDLSDALLGFQQWPGAGGAARVNDLVGCDGCNCFAHK